MDVVKRSRAELAKFNRKCHVSPIKSYELYALRVFKARKPYLLVKIPCTGLVENAGTRICGYADMRVCGYAGMRICRYADMRVCGYAGMRICRYADMRVCGYAGMRICGYADMRICGYADMRVRRTGLTNRFQKLINNSNKIIAVNTKNHSCEGVFICGKTHVDFHKTLTSIFSAYTTSIY